MATYVVTIPDVDHRGDLAPDAHKTMIAVAAALYGEDIAQHCVFAPHVDPVTGDDVAHHYRLGLTVRRLP